MAENMTRQSMAAAASDALSRAIDAAHAYRLVHGDFYLTTPAFSPAILLSSALTIMEQAECDFYATSTKD